MGEENTKEEAKVEKKWRKIDIILVAIIIIAFVSVIVIILVSASIEKKKSDERMRKIMSGFSDDVQKITDEYNEKVDEIFEDMRNDPKLK